MAGRDPVLECIQSRSCTRCGSDGTAKDIAEITTTLHRRLRFEGASTALAYAGSVAYRLIVGPLPRDHRRPRGATAGGRVDARFLFILGEANRVPEGISLSLLAILGL